MDSLQIRGGPKAGLPRLAERALGYCTDARELHIGTPEGNVLLAAARTLQAVERLRADTDASTERIQAAEGALETLQGALEALRGTVGGLESSLQTVKDGLSALSGQVSVLSNQYSALEARVATLEGGGGTGT